MIVSISQAVENHVILDREPITLNCPYSVGFLSYCFDPDPDMIIRYGICRNLPMQSTMIGLLLR